MKFLFPARGLLLVILMSVHSLLFAAYGAVADFPKIQLNKGGSIKAIVELADGSLIIGGQFTLINGREQVGLARLNPDGTLDEDWNAKVRGGVTPAVNALVLAGDSLYVGGNFFGIDGISRKGGIARIDVATAHVDTSWDPHDDFDNPGGTVYTMKLTHDGEHLFVGGLFQTLGGKKVTSIARISTLTADVDPDWKPLVEGSSQVFIWDMLLSGDDLYIAGQFTEVGGISHQGIARVSATGTGTVDPQWDAKIDNNFVHALEISEDGNQLYIGGSFYSINSVSRWGLARLGTANGELDTTWDPAASGSPFLMVEEITLSADGLYVGGSFSNIGGQSRNNVALLSTTDATANSWNPDAGTPVEASSTHVQAILPSADGSRVHLGGSFNTMGNIDAMAFASVDKTSGNLVNGFTDLNIGNPGEIRSIAIKGDSLYFGGMFIRVNNQPRHYMGKWDLANNTLADWDGQFDDRIWAIAVSGDGNSVYAGGSFSHAGGLERNHLAKLAAADAAVDAAWNPNANNAVTTLLINGNHLYLGGFFNEIGGIAQKHLVRLAAGTGALDTTWTPNPDKAVYALALSGTNLYAGGSFNNIGGQARKMVAKIDTTTGNADPAWMANADGSVKALALSGNALFVGGYFKNIGGQARIAMAKLSTADGNVAAGWDLALSSYSRIEALATSTDGENLYLGGRSFKMGGTGDYRSLAKVTTADGVRDTQWDPKPENNAQVLTLTATTDGIYAGGQFFGIGGKSTALAHIVDGHLLTLAFTATNTDAYAGALVSTPEGLACSPHSLARQECSRAFVPGDITLNTLSTDPAIVLSQQWISGCASGGGNASSCSLTLDGDKTVEVELSCESHDVPQPDQPVSTFRNISCNNIKAVHGFETGDGGKTTFTATESVELGPGFRVSDAPGFFKVRMQ
ncbi:delta-60 repeat domain-containing protein [Thiolapillus sp.]